MSKSKGKSKKHTLRNRRVKRSKRAVTKKQRQRQYGGSIPEHAVLANPLSSDAAGEPDSDAK